jgi:ectoine hydroxylase-related dioxygenase (phytanoyl-CoA dioxygenase family)
MEIGTTLRDFNHQVAEDGFAVTPDVFPSEQLDRLMEEIDDQPSHRSRAGIRHALSIKPVTLLAQHPELINLAYDVLGPNAFPFRATLFDKSPQSNWLVVWHQDTALPLQQRQEVEGWGPWSVKEGIDYAHAPAATLSRILALRVHLDDSTSQNGPLRVLPGTHTLGVLSDEALHELANRISPVDCLVPKGGVLAMRPLLVHSSSKSRTEAARRVLHIEYAASAAVAKLLDLAVV